MTAVERAESEAAPSDRTEALPDGTCLLGDQYTITSRLSNGGFGITYLATDNYLDRTVVIKECFPEVFCHREGTSVLVRSQSNSDKYRSIVDMFMREARSIAKMRHPNIVGVHRVFEDNDTAYMALDLIEGQDLRQFMKDGEQTLPARQIREMLIRLLDAIDMVHKQDLLHRDISPDNILLDKWGNPVLIDFGAAREEASRESRALSAILVVKDGYSPQEFYFAGGKQSACSDLYALAATFYHLISGEAPPNSQTRMAEVAGGGADPCEPLAGRFDEYAPEFLSAIDKAMSVLPKERLQSAQEWADMIAPRKNGAAPLVLATTKPQPSKLGQNLTKLVSETNEFVRNSKPQENKEQKATPRAEVKRTSVPDWVHEFNAETPAVANEKPIVEPPVKRKSRDTAPLEDPEIAVADVASEPLVPQQDVASPVNSKFKHFGSRLWARVDKIRATWMVAVFAVSVVQTENIIRIAESLLY